jgi:uncharacterized protein (TIGR00251 family)
VKIDQREGAVRFAVHVQPRASRTELAGLHGDALKVRLAAPPVDGAANEALVIFLSERFAVPRRTVRIVSGAQSRAKTVEIDGLTAEDLRRLLNQKD